MRPLQVLFVFLTLGGCSSNHSEQEPAQLIPAPPEVSQRRIPLTLSPAGRSASSKPETLRPWQLIDGLRDGSLHDQLF